MSTGQERYRQYLQSDDWKKKRARKRAKRDRCAICGDTKRLDVHHLNYRNWTDVQMSDLRVLCRRCHEVAHGLMKRGVIRFKSDSHHSRFAITKNAVRREIGEAGMHWTTDQGALPKSWRPKPAVVPSTRMSPKGWTRERLAAWGIPWPPPKGWMRTVEAKMKEFQPVWTRP